MIRKPVEIALMYSSWCVPSGVVEENDIPSGVVEDGIVDDSDIPSGVVEVAVDGGDIPSGVVEVAIYMVRVYLLSRKVHVLSAWLAIFVAHGLWPPCLL